MINALVNADVDQSMPGRLTWADCTTSWPFMTTTIEGQLIIRSSSSWQLQCNGRAADNNHYFYSGGNYVMSPLLFNHTKENTMLHTPTQAKIMTHIRSKMWTSDNGISRDTSTLTKQTTTVAFDTWVGTEDLILITKILSLNGSRIRRSYQDARKKFPWFTFPQFSILSQCSRLILCRRTGICVRRSQQNHLSSLLEASWKTDVTDKVSFFKTNKGKEHRQIQTVCVEKYCQQSAGVNRVRVAADCRPSVHLPLLESWAGGGQLIWATLI